MGRIRTRAILTVALAAGAGAVAAQQPAPIQPPPLQPPPLNPPTSNGPPPAEEAPPAKVAPPPPVVAAPPIEAQEVAPAPPPAEKVATKATEEPLKRQRYDVAVIQALDKISARSVRFEAQVGQPVRYRSLVFTVRACERAAADEAQDDSIAHVTVQSQPRSAPGKPTPPPRQAFRGWMYASSPSLNPLEHPVYDAWLITCRARSPEAVASR
ncbi:MAG: DUF2155 domain-containing protein [Phenylobacterium sp.]|uniref:DUF2155 domain-containing protein n=1 Tax=Phenylobacterium sp. TaxID=1871053 RepID=UPI00391932FF